MSAVAELEHIRGFPMAKLESVNICSWQGKSGGVGS